MKEKIVHCRTLKKIIVVEFQMDWITKGLFAFERNFNFIVTIMVNY